MGTVFDLGALDPVLDGLGALPQTRKVWFGRLLDASKALTVIGEYVPFPELARSTLRSVLASQDVDPVRADEVVDALAQIPAYPDAAGAFARLAEAGVPVVVLTNGGLEVTEGLLERAGLRGQVLTVLASEQVQAYKPSGRLYLLVCEQFGVRPDRCALIAAHGWDVRGALAAGFEAVWVDRLEREWPFPGDPPALRAHDLEQAAALVGGLG